MMLPLLAIVLALASPALQPPPASPSPFAAPSTPTSQATPGQPNPGETSPDTATASIKGRVLGKDSGAPLRHASVQLYGGTPNVNESTTTDTQGRFTFTELQGGRYTIIATKGGYVSMQYGQKEPLEPGRPIEIAPAQQLDKIDFDLPRGGVITGEIVDDAGEPVTGAVVRPMRYRYIDGGRRLTPWAGAAQTDDRGIYRLFGLAPGTYYVMATWNDTMMNDNASHDQTGYAPTFYPGTADAGLAAPLAVNASQPCRPCSPGFRWAARRAAPTTTGPSRSRASWGQSGSSSAICQEHATGLQIVLTNKLTDVSGVATDENDAPLTDYTLVIFPVDQQRWGTQSRYIRLVRPDQNGRFETKGLPPGDYYAAAVASIEQGSQDDPSLLQQLSNNATKFSLAEGESKTLNLVEQQQ
ncbi:MAG TPA: carboxypeptidase-like regulatory domain-containing protein [Vicinamibacterales bacterium]